jgi:iron complex transport system substrate-binding protein
MRIVSLVPAATEIAWAIGAGADLVAVTHDCDYPPAARDLPRVTRSTIAAGTTSAKIDDAVRAAAERGESTFHLDGDALARARADVLLGQTLCAVCAVTVAQVPRAPGAEPAVVPLDGDSIDGILRDIERVGDALGRSDAAGDLVASLRERMARIEALVAGASRPSVVCLEWLEPLFGVGHWVPEQVSIAGGSELLGRALTRSAEVTLDDVAAVEPEYLFLMPCGFDAERAVSESAALRANPLWRDLAAVRAGNVYALDGNAYFSRPGPRVVDGIEVLASILHPDRVPGARATAIRLPELVT